jgi:hypothetical protein
MTARWRRSLASGLVARPDHSALDDDDGGEVSMDPQGADDQTRLATNAGCTDPHRGRGAEGLATEDALPLRVVEGEEAPANRGQNVMTSFSRPRKRAAMTRAC